MEAVVGALAGLALLGWLYYGARRSQESWTKRRDAIPPDLRRADDVDPPDPPPTGAWNYPT